MEVDTQRRMLHGVGQWRPVCLWIRNYQMVTFKLRVFSLNFKLSEMIVDYYVYDLIFLWDAAREVIVVQM